MYGKGFAHTFWKLFLIQDTKLGAQPCAMVSSMMRDFGTFIPDTCRNLYIASMHGRKNLKKIQEVTRVGRSLHTKFQVKRSNTDWEIEKKHRKNTKKTRKNTKIEQKTGPKLVLIGFSQSVLDRFGWNSVCGLLSARVIFWIFFRFFCACVEALRSAYAQRCVCVVKNSEEIPENHLHIEKAAPRFSCLKSKIYFRMYGGRKSLKILENFFFDSGAENWWVAYSPCAWSSGIFFRFFWHTHAALRKKSRRASTHAQKNLKKIQKITRMGVGLTTKFHPKRSNTDWENPIRTSLGPIRTDFLARVRVFQNFFRVKIRLFSVCIGPFCLKLAQESLPYL